MFKHLPVYPATALWWSYWNCTCFREIGKLRGEAYTISFILSLMRSFNKHFSSCMSGCSGFAALQVRAECLAGSKLVRRRLELLNKVPQTGWLKEGKFIFLPVWSLEVLGDMVSTKASLCGLHEATFSPCPHVAFALSCVSLRFLCPRTSVNPDVH